MSTVIVAVVSGKGSPGASTTALGMTISWPRPVLLLEADPAGASATLGYAAAADTAGRSLTGVRVAARRTRMQDALWANVVSLGETCWLLPGAATTRQAEAVDYAAIGKALPDLGVDVIVDAGRIPGPVAHYPLWASATAVLVAMRSTLPAVHAAQAAAAAALEATHVAGAVWSGELMLRSVVIGAGRPYSERDIRAAMSDIAAVAGQVTWDPAFAGALVDAMPAPHSWARSPLLRSTGRLATSLVAQAESAAPAAAQIAAPAVVLTAERSRAADEAPPAVSRRVRDLLLAARAGGDQS